ncbi:MAG: hypothetical protein AAFS06_23200 [Cyanobacteria bacterium J06631_12]
MQKTTNNAKKGSAAFCFAIVKPAAFCFAIVEQGKQAALAQRPTVSLHLESME